MELFFIMYSHLNVCSFHHRLGLAYAGSNRQDVLSLILPVLADPKSNLEVNVCFQKL